MTIRVLVVEDDRSWQQILYEILNDSGFIVDQVDNISAAYSIITEQSHRIAIVDLSLAGADHSNQDGLKVLDYLKSHDPDCATILLTGFATVEIAVTALSVKGAYSCLRKEMFHRAEFKDLIDRALSTPVKNPHQENGSQQLDLDLFEVYPAGNDVITVLVVEDDAGWRDIFREILEDAGYQVNLCSGYGEALGYLKRNSCDVAVIDLSLEGKSYPVSRRSQDVLQNFEGYHLLSVFRSRNTPRIVVSGEASINEIDTVYDEQDVFAFIEKQTFSRRGFLQTVEDAIQTRSSRVLLEKLTTREREVLELLAHAKTNREIAESLVITQNTVKRHLKAIFEKLDIHTRSAAAVLAASWFNVELRDQKDLGQTDPSTS